MSINKKGIYYIRIRPIRKASEYDTGKEIESKGSWYIVKVKI